MRRILAAAAIAGAVLAAGAPAHADPGDPHVPNPWVGWCPGGGWGGFYGWGYCDGRPYPDGTKWHQLRAMVPFVGPTWQLSCVLDTPDAIPPAAPGGCGGAG